MAVLEVYSAQLETCLLTPVYDRPIPLICQGQDLLMAYALWQPQRPLQVSHTTGAVADTLPALSDYDRRIQVRPSILGPSLPVLALVLPTWFSNGPPPPAPPTIGSTGAVCTIGLIIC